MSEIIDHTKPEIARNSRVHMANERTFLAWIRTSIGIMAFGFVVVERFALFIKQMSYVIGNSNIENTFPPSHSYSAIAGISLVGLGALISVLAFINYKRVTRQIEQDTYEPTTILHLLLTLSVFAVGIFLVFYLVQSKVASL